MLRRRLPENHIPLDDVWCRSVESFCDILSHYYISLTWSGSSPNSTDFPHLLLQFILSCNSWSLNSFEGCASFPVNLVLQIGQCFSFSYCRRFIIQLLQNMCLQEQDTGFKNTFWHSLQMKESSTSPSNNFVSRPMAMQQETYNIHQNYLYS